MFDKLLKKPILIYLFVLFAFMLIVGLLIPYGGDDWNNYLYKKASLVDVFDIAKNFYFSYEGRFFSRIFDAILVPRQCLWAFINASLMCLLFYMITKIINVNNKLLLSLIFLCIIFVDMQAFAQVYVWKTGNVTYFIPMVFAFLLIFRRQKLFTNDDVNILKWDYLLVPLSLIFTMFVENVGFVITVICLLNVIFYFIRYKKIDIPMLLCFVFSLIGLVVMLISPGNAVRMALESDFSRLSFLSKVMYNIPNLITYTFIKNSFFLLIVLFIMVTLCHKNVKRRYLKFLIYVLFIICPIFTIVSNLFSYTRFNAPHIFDILLDTSRWYIDVYWIMFTVVFVSIFLKYVKLDEFKIYFLILTFCSMAVMMMSPTWGGRTAILTTFMLYMIVLVVLFELDIDYSKAVYIVFNFIIGLFVLLFSIYSFYIYKLNIDRNKYINYQLKNNYEKIDVIILPGYWTWNLNTWDSDGGFAYNFKKSYGIKKDTELNYVREKDVKINLKKLKTSSKIKTKWEVKND